MFSAGLSFDDCVSLSDKPGPCWLFARDQNATWQQAAQTCISLGGYLAIEHEQAMRVSIASELLEYDPDSGWWIGLSNTLYDDWWWRTLYPLCMSNVIIPTHKTNIFF